MLPADIEEEIDAELAKPDPEPEPDYWRVVEAIKENILLEEIDNLYAPPLAQQNQLTNKERQRLETLERVCEGLTQDAIDGGWTVKGIIEYLKFFEKLFGIK